MAIEDNNLYSGEKIHRVKRSQELSPEILSIQKRQNSTRGIYSPLISTNSPSPLIFLTCLGSGRRASITDKRGSVKTSLPILTIIPSMIAKVRGSFSFTTDL